MITIERTVHFGRGQSSRKELRGGKATKPAPVGRIPRVSRLMALAIRFDQLIRDGVVTDQAELARLGHVTRARVTQIMDLLSLAPDIQEAVLFLPPVRNGRDPITEQDIRSITLSLDWAAQSEMFNRCCRPESR